MSEAYLSCENNKVIFKFLITIFKKMKTVSLFLFSFLFLVFSQQVLSVKYSNSYLQKIYGKFSRDKKLIIVPGLHYLKDFNFIYLSKYFFF